jgi:hypothetical protein
MSCDYVGALILFEEHQGLAHHMAIQLHEKYPHLDLNDIKSKFIDSLFESSKKHNPFIPGRKGDKYVPFGPFALKALCWTSNRYVKKHVKRAPKEVSLDEVVKEDFTRADKVANQVAEKEVAGDIPELRDESLLADIREVIQGLPTVQAQVLTLLFFEDMDGEQIQKKLKIIRHTFKLSVRKGIQAIREHYRKKGIKVVDGAFMEVGTISGTMRRHHPNRPKNPKAVARGKKGQAVLHEQGRLRKYINRGAK